MPVDERKAVIKQCDMEDKMAQEAVDAAVNALDKYDMPRDIAEYIKKQFDTKYDRTWFCIVGKHFGSAITHSEHSLIHFTLDNRTFLLFRWS
ncbi:unnamed protein product [Calicophoron daubneyi]|uniref:Dynein light chain n=1 Tax=Calicophoron daubneyi TaxID=300641 RepID=A0AAV2TRC6_CALDB